MIITSLSFFSVIRLNYFMSFGRNLLTFSLERRWSSRTFRYGYLVTTSPQSLTSPSTALSKQLPSLAKCFACVRIFLFSAASNLCAYKELYSCRFGVVLKWKIIADNVLCHAWKLLGWVTGFGRFQLPWCDGRCVQDPGTYSPRHSDSRLLAIPTSCSRVADYNPNWDDFSGVCSRSPFRFPLLSPL